MSDVGECIESIYSCKSHVCEIFLARNKWITANIQRDDKDENALAEYIFRYLDGEFGSQPQDQCHIKDNLLWYYWQLTKSTYINAKLYLIQAFRYLIKCGGVLSQNATNISNRIQSKAVKRSTSVEVNRAEHDDFMMETAKVHRLMMECSKTLERIERDVVNNTAIGDRGRVVFKALRNNKLKQEKLPVDLDVPTIRSEYTEKRKALFKEFKQLFENLKENLKSLYLCIEKWKESHKKAYIKVAHQFNINVLKHGCSEACKLILKMIELLNKDVYQRMVSCSDITDHPHLDQESLVHEDIEKQLVEDFKELFKRCFVVEVEPTDVQKVTGPSEKGKKKGKAQSKKGANDEEVKSNKSGPEFNVSVSILCAQGLECISTVMKPVKAKLYYEDNQKHGGCVSGELSIPQVAVGKDGIADFTKQKITKFKRPGKSNKAEQVPSERYRIVFETDLSIQNPNITIELKTMSLPMAMITGSNQANSAHGALLWYCYNTDPYRLSSFPTSIPTDRFKDMIQACFTYFDGRHLRDDEMDFLLDKLFKQENKNIKSEVKYEDFEVTHKSKVDKAIPFWRWLQAILNLIEFFLLKPWQDGVIYGFVSKQHTDELLYNEPDGVFLLRFSESVVVGDGQNKNLTGAIVAAFSRGTGSKPVLSRPLTVDSYFKKYSLYAVLSGIQNEEKGRQLLKKLYGTKTTIKDFKALYNKCDNKDTKVQDNSYPNWSEQTLLRLSDSINQMELSDDDDDDDNEGDDDEDNDDGGEIKRKIAKKRHESMNSNVYSPETLNDQIQTEIYSPSVEMTIPSNAIDELLAGHNFQHTHTSTSTFNQDFPPLISNVPREFQNAMILPDGTVMNAVTMSSSEPVLQQAIGQISSQSNQTSVLSPSNVNMISPVHSEVPSPGNTPSHMVLGPEYSPPFDYGTSTWCPVDPQSSQQNDRISSSIPVPVQEELSNDFMNLSGPSNVSDL